MMEQYTKKTPIDKDTIALLKETQSHMGLTEGELLKRFVHLAKKVSRKKGTRSPIHYYTLKTRRRLQQDQLHLFLEECVGEGLLQKYHNKYIVSWPGKACIYTNDISLLIPPYERAMEKIQRIYVDVLI
jgi:hypothetical protein